jgi:uncharacterized protein (DUF2236 family)
MFVLTRTFGTTEEAGRAGRRICKVHDAITGTEPDGSTYRVDEPELLLWVHCGEVASVVEVARRSRLPFTAAELDTFVAEQRASAALVGLDPALAPTSVAGLRAYFKQMQPSLHACREAMQALTLALDPPLPGDSHLFRLILPRLNLLAFATLPSWARQLYGRPGGRHTDALATAGLRATRVALGRRPVLLTAMRAIHRAEQHGEE